ncbi:phosphodiester glycosidase family protein [Streptacidiphilus sp. 4-A2]|nr:phosphodiester glycosidase family protein [Streptacidiphilus sp. 4-A2]
MLVADLIDGRARSASAADCSATDFSVLRPVHSAVVAVRPRPAVAVVPLHPPVVPLVSPAMPGEGVFSPLVEVHGQPVVQRALMRPDGYDATFPVGVVWLRHSALRFELHPGAAEPGGDWPVPPTVPPGHRAGLVATYNGGFKLSNGDSHGGFYLDGQVGAPLVDGAATEVFHRDGSLTVGVWNQDVRMAPDVVGVRQCLVPLVSGGEVTAAVHDGGTEVWGLTDGGNSFVARSGVGVDRHGDIIYVGGRLMSVETLATVLQRAGAVTAMTGHQSELAVVHLVRRHPAAGRPGAAQPGELRPRTHPLLRGVQPRLRRRVRTRLTLPTPARRGPRGPRRARFHDSALVGPGDLADQPGAPRAPHIAGQEGAARLVQVLLHKCRGGVADLDGSVEEAHRAGLEVEAPAGVVRRGVVPDPADEVRAVGAAAQQLACVPDVLPTGQLDHEFGGPGTVAVSHHKVGGALDGPTDLGRRPLGLSGLGQRDRQHRNCRDAQDPGEHASHESAPVVC